MEARLKMSPMIKDMKPGECLHWDKWEGWKTLSQFPQSTLSTETIPQLTGIRGLHVPCCSVRSDGRTIVAIVGHVDVLYANQKVLLNESGLYGYLILSCPQDGIKISVRLGEIHSDGHSMWSRVLEYKDGDGEWMTPEHSLGVRLVAKEW